MRLLDTIAEMFRQLHRADQRLQAEFRSLLQRYFQFLKTASPGTYHGTHHLRMRADRDGQGHIRRLSWTARIRKVLQVGGRAFRATRRLPGRLRHPWIFHIAKDWARRDRYDAFERERSRLNAARSHVAKVLRILRLSYQLGWTPKASSKDHLEAQALARPADSGLHARDLRALAGASAFARDLRAVEAETGLLIQEYRRTFESSEVSFEPVTRTTANGTLFLYWGSPQRIQTREGRRTRTEYLPGRPSDRWMRHAGLRTLSRRRVGAFLKRLFPLERRHRKLAALLGRHRRRVGEVLARVAKVLAARAPDPVAHLTRRN